MSKVIASEYQTQDRLEFRTRQPIRAEDWKELVSMQNLLLSRHGERISGITWDDPQGFDIKTADAWTTTSDTPGTRSFDEYFPTFRFHRRGVDGQAFLGLQAYGKDYRVRATLRNVSTGDEIYCIITGTELLEWTSDTFAIPTPFFIDASGNSMQLRLSYEVIGLGTGAQDLALYQLDSYGAILTEADLPEKASDFEPDLTLPFTINNAANTGTDGPSQGDVDTEYGDDLGPFDEITIFGSSGKQSCISLPAGQYEFTVAGAQGGVGGGVGGTRGGYGAVIVAEIDTASSNEVYIVVGQEGESNPSAVYAGGGGGTYVEFEDPIQIVAGGGGAFTSNGSTTYQTVADANHDSTAGKDAGSGNIAGAGGTGGNGGAAASSRGAGGGGYLSDGADSSAAGTGGHGQQSDNIGGSGTAFGGFGGGGANGLTTSYGGAGGGGGYSGGGGAYASPGGDCAGGGGGSYVNGATTIGTEATNTGHGYVTIRRIYRP